MRISWPARWREDLQVEILQKRNPRVLGKFRPTGQNDGRYLSLRRKKEIYGKKEFWVKSEVEDECGSFQYVEDVTELAGMEKEYMLIRG